MKINAGEGGFLFPAGGLRACLNNRDYDPGVEILHA
jgi:hypothetical protein